MTEHGGYVTDGLAAFGKRQVTAAPVAVSSGNSVGDFAKIKGLI